jgi:hypothetical protein
MTVRECCIQMVKTGRAKMIEGQLHLFNANGRPSRSIKNNKDRLYWHLFLDGKYRYLQISHLTWLAAGFEIPEGMTIDHIDRNAMNNDLGNLRTATPGEQSDNRAVNKTNKSLRAWMRDQFESGKKTIRGMARDMGLRHETVRDIIHRRYASDQIKLESVG